MHKQIFVNLPVKNLSSSMTFFKELGYSFDMKFTNEQAACMILGENLYAMLLTESFFQGFSSKPISDATKQSEVLVCLSCDSRTQVDSLVASARAGGATTPREPQDHGFMYGHGFDDLDGHTWEFVYMEPQPA